MVQLADIRIVDVANIESAIEVDQKLAVAEDKITGHGTQSYTMERGSVLGRSVDQACG